MDYMKYLFYLLITLLVLNFANQAFPKTINQEAIVFEKKFIEGEPGLLSSAKRNDRYMITFCLPNEDYADVYVSAKVYHNLDNGEKVIVGRNVSRVTSRKRGIEWISRK